MNTKKIYAYIGIACISLMYTGCKVPANMAERKENKNTPGTYANGTTDTLNTGKVFRKDFFTDPNLSALIEEALKNNQELNITIQEINIAQNEVRGRKGAYLPSVGVGAGADVIKTPRYTNIGALEENIDIKPGQKTPDPLPNFQFGAYANWEVDIWRKLRNSKKAAVSRYLASKEGMNFMVTNLVAEIAASYYELISYDNQLQILQNNITIQQNALEIVKLEKISAKVTELAVRRFEAEVLKNQSRQYYIQQQIIETENHINFLVGRFPQPIQRNSVGFLDIKIDTIYNGIPSQLLANRPDIREAELQLAASKLDVKAARAQFYPSLNITAGIGYQAFNPKYLVTTPQSLLYTLAGDLMAPLINRNAIKAEYYSASSRQVQAVYNYERTILNGYVEVANQVSNIGNLKKSYELKEKQVQALTQSIDISTGLFKSARADYMEVLLTQRDALEARFELVETKMQQVHARINIYRALGGGWQ